jgi:hypothetical protein
MTKQKRTKYQVLGLVSLSLIIAAMTYGFASVNSVESAGILGVGYGTKSPFDVTRINYTLDVEDPSSFTAVEFVVEQEGAQVFAGVSATKNGPVTWADECENDGPKWTCTFDGSIGVLEADWLHVSEVQ